MSSTEPASAPGTSPDPSVSEGPPSLYEQFGGHAAFKQLTEEFYRQVAADPDFAAMYPEEDLEPARKRLEMFLEQYWGGPAAYQQQRGHPRLRMRHHPFRIDPTARQKWLDAMRTALDTLDLPPMLDGLMWDYFERAAFAMTNTPG